MRTKRRVLLFVGLVVVLFCPVRAQETFRKEWVAGVSGGINASSVFFAPKVQQQMLFGYNGGLTVRWTTEKNLGLQLEVSKRPKVIPIPKRILIIDTSAE